MHAPTMGAPREVAAGVVLLPSYLPLANLGVLPVNAFLLQAAEPVLLDTGMAPVREGFLRSLRSASTLGTFAGSTSPTPTRTTWGTCSPSWPRHRGPGSSRRSWGWGR